MKNEDKMDVIRKIMSEIIKSKYANVEKTRKMCYRLIEMSEKEHYNYGIAFGNYYLCELCMYEDDIDGMISGVIDFIPYVTDNRFNDLLMRSYNILGIAFYMKGNLITAMDYLLKAAECKECDDYEAILALVYGNISCIYGSIDAYEDQLRCCKKTYELYRKQTERPELIVPKMLAVINMADVYLKLGEIEKAGKCLKKIENHKQRDKIKEVAWFDYSVLMFKYEFLSGNYEKAYECLDTISNADAGIFDQRIRFEGYIDVCTMLIEHGEYARITGMIDYLTQKAKTPEIRRLKIALAELEVSYYKAIEDKENLFKAYEKFYEYKMQLREKEAEDNLGSLKARIALKKAMDDKIEIMKNNSELKNLAEIDELTTLPNRRKYEIVINEMHREAVLKRVNLGVILIDVDCFKQYNDTYGHVKGDSCLRKIGKQIKNEMNENILCARYGGDEFCVILLNKSNEFVIKCAKRIENSISKLDIRHETSTRLDKVSITTGVCNYVPDELSTIEEFINKADENLYHIKHQWKTDKNDKTNKCLAI